jgi:hypothetical protein
MQIQSTQNINSRKQLLVKSYVPNLKATKKEKGDCVYSEYKKIWASNTRWENDYNLASTTDWGHLVGAPPCGLQQTGGTWLELHPVVYNRLGAPGWSSTLWSTTDWGHLVGAPPCGLQQTGGTWLELHPVVYNRLGAPGWSSTLWSSTTNSGEYWSHKQEA